jgi:hypothetical protein
MRAIAQPESNLSASKPTKDRAWTHLIGSAEAPQDRQIGGSLGTARLQKKSDKSQSDAAVEQPRADHLDVGSSGFIDTASRTMRSSMRERPTVLLAEP